MLSHFAGNIARRVAKLLDERPSDWRRDGNNYFRHKSGLTIWAHHDASYLHLEIGNGNAQLWCPTMIGSPNQRCVWNALQRWLIRTNGAAIIKALETAEASQ